MAVTRYESLWPIGIIFLVPAFVCGQPVDELVTYPGWGTFTDPDGDCKVRIDGQKLVLTVPPKFHDLHTHGKTNSPRVLQAVRDSFDVHVKVSGKFIAGTKSTIADGAVRFLAGGIVIWHDNRNYVRMEWATTGAGENVADCPNYHAYKNGKWLGVRSKWNRRPFFKPDGVYMRLTRTDGLIKGWYSHDGETWEKVHEMEVALPDQVQIGVYAINTANAEHTVVFEDLQVRKMQSPNSRNKGAASAPGVE